MSGGSVPALRANPQGRVPPPPESGPPRQAAPRTPAAEPSQGLGSGGAPLGPVTPERLAPERVAPMPNQALLAGAPTSRTEAAVSNQAPLSSVPVKNEAAAATAAAPQPSGQAALPGAGGRALRAALAPWGAIFPGRRDRGGRGDQGNSSKPSFVGSPRLLEGAEAAGAGAAGSGSAAAQGGFGGVDGGVEGQMAQTPRRAVTEGQEGAASAPLLSHLHTQVHSAVALPCGWQRIQRHGRTGGALILGIIL